MNRRKQNHFKRHAKARATQRLGIDLHKNLHDQIVVCIQEGKYKLLYKSSKERAIYEYNEEYSVVYDKKRKCLVTFIPKERSIIVPKGEPPESLKPESLKPESLKSESLNPSFPIRRFLNGD
jgi:hypothetical protein